MRLWSMRFDPEGLRVDIVGGDGVHARLVAP